MLDTIKSIILTVVFIVCVYAVLGGYIVAMFNGNLPLMENHEPPEMCAVFPDGVVYGRDSFVSIKAYHEKTKQSFEMVECK